MSNIEQDSIFDPNHPDFDWDAFLEREFSRESSSDEDAGGDAPDGETDDGAGVASAEDPADGDEEPDRSGSDEAPVADATPATVNVGGVEIPAESAAQVASFWKWMNDYPQQAQEFLGYLQGEYDLTPRQAQQVANQVAQQAYNGDGSTPPQSAPAAEDDDEDWTFVPPSVRQKLSRLDEIEARVAAYDNAIRQQEIAYAQAAIDQAVDQFRQTYDVTDDDLNRIRIEAGNLGLAGRLAQQYGDPVRATREALEIAYMRDPEFKEREAARQQREALAERQRQQKMAGIGGTGGSAPRQTAPPRTREDRTKAMTAEIATAILGGQDN